MSDAIKLYFEIPGHDLATAGEASSSVKKMLNQLGVSPHAIKKAAVSMYEAELNAVIHAQGGTANIEISQERIIIEINDQGPGIPDIELAMQEGYSTAPDYIREMGFGAGMGLPNMKRYADEFSLASEVGKSTKVRLVVNLNQ